MDKIDTVVDQTIEVANRGIERGFVLPRVLMERIPDQIAVQLVENGEESPFYRTFETMPGSITEKDQERLRETAIKTIEDTVVPAYRKLARYFEKTYLPATRETVGLSSLPNGSAWYESGRDSPYGARRGQAHPRGDAADYRRTGLRR
jgi:uncharacterized protein (DUF885 family)